jgi:nucleotide-binding universal stress UspA family protein
LKILWAVDGATYPAASLNLLTHILWPAGTLIHLLALIPQHHPIPEIAPEAGSVVGEALELLHWRQWAAAKILATELTRRLKTHGLTLEAEIYEGQPDQALLTWSEKLSVHLIVIGATEFSPPGKFRLSSTVYDLIHQANCSVLVVRPSEQVRPLNIVLAFDGSPEAWHAMEFLSTLSLPQWAKVTLVNVVEDEAEAAPVAGLSLRRAYTTTRQATAAVRERYITKAREILHAYGVQLWSTIRFGSPADEIIAIAQEQGADLIVIGAPGQTITQKVVEYAPCSVLVMRPEETQTDAPGSGWRRDKVRQPAQLTNSQAVPETV